jgi:hypothetical protein
MRGGCRVAPGRDASTGAPASPTRHLDDEVAEAGKPADASPAGEQVQEEQAAKRKGRTKDAGAEPADQRRQEVDGDADDESGGAHLGVSAVRFV